MDADAYREQSLDTWREMAPGWEARREWLLGITSLVNDWVVEQLDPQPGQTILELAAGPGDLGFAIAERVGPAGRVIGTDFAPEMVEVARRNGSRRGLTGVEHRVLDAERMDLADDSVDGVVCRWGYMLMADPAAALKETRRVLRDGGSLVFAVWRSAELNPWAAVPAMTLVQRGHMPPPQPGDPGIFALGDPERVRELVAAAGFAEARLEEIAFEFHHADADDVWDALVQLAGPLARAVRALPDDEREATRVQVLENVAAFRNDDGSFSEPAATWGVVAH